MLDDHPDRVELARVEPMATEQRSRELSLQRREPEAVAPIPPQDELGQPEQSPHTPS